jgi:hypothetical protein
MAEAAARCWVRAAFIAALGSAGVWAGNTAAAKMAAMAICPFPIFMRIFLESGGAGADVMGEGRKASRLWQ